LQKVVHVGHAQNKLFHLERVQRGRVADPSARDGLLALSHETRVLKKIVLAQIQ
jgi:hypothetical protein